MYVTVWRLIFLLSRTPLNLVFICWGGREARVLFTVGKRSSRQVGEHSSGEHEVPLGTHGGLFICNLS